MSHTEDDMCPLQDDSAVTEGQTSSLLPPGDVEKVIEPVGWRLLRYGQWTAIMAWDEGQEEAFKHCLSNGERAELLYSAATLTTSTEENKRLRVENERLQSEMPLLTASNDHLEHEYRKVRAALTASQSQAEAAQAERDALRVANNLLNEALTIEVAQRGGYRDQAEAAQAEIEKLKARIDALSEAGLNAEYNEAKAVEAAEAMKAALEGLAQFADQRSEEWFAMSNEADTSYAESDRLAAKSAAADEIADAIRTALSIKGGESNG